MKQRKIAIIGAGSAQFSGGIIRDLCVTPNLYGTKLTLMDVDAQRLKFIADMGKKLAREIGGSIEFETTMDRAEALKGADYVINTAQDQGHSWAGAQARMMRAAGFSGGGMLGMLYQTLFLVDVARDMQRHCPDALHIQSANPVFEGGTAMHRQTGIKTIGLCHGHYGYREIADVLGLERAHVTARMYGFNHWIWMTDFRYKGEDAYPLIDRWIEEKSEDYWRLERRYADQQMSRAAIHQYKMFGLMPIGDTPRMMDYPSMVGWLYNKTLEAKKYWYSQQGGFDSEEGWAQYLEDLNNNLLDIQRVASDENSRVTDVFEPVQSDEQIVPIIESLECDIPRVYQVNIPNRGRLVDGFPEDIVVECEAVVSGAGVRGIQMGRLPSQVMAGAMNPRFAQCELLCEASTGSIEALRVALLMHHGAKSLQQVDELIAQWLGDPRNRYAPLFR
jgi:alpha-galactosidase